jgi:anti-sigma B factor antagonist
MTRRFSGLEIDERVGDGRCTLVLGGELDIASAPVLHAAVSRICQHGTAGAQITLDLSELIFIDSTGLAEIILTSQLCDRDGFELTVIPSPRAVQRLFELTGLIDALPFAQATDAPESSEVIEP